MGCAGEFGWVKIISQEIFVVEVNVDSVVIGEKFVGVCKKFVGIWKK